jgi:glycerol-3-phosphate dehydrogenase (NAD(P)+)
VKRKKSRNGDVEMKGTEETSIFVVGAGSWGTTLAIHCTWMGHRVTLWEKFEETARQIMMYRENRTYLPGIEIPADLRVTTDMAVLGEAFDVVLFAVPSQFIRATAREASRCFSRSVVITSATKGLERGTLSRVSEVLGEELDPDLTGDIVVLSGPSHAEEVSRKLPTTIVSASRDREKAEFIQRVMTSTHLRVYTNEDVVGVELGGALKNIIAIANGICAGLGYGDNTTGALITRGIAEISRLGVVMGADPMTFSGLSGIGDLITTCVSGHSRNRHVGVELAKGRRLDDIVREMVMVAEGIETTRAAVELSRRYDIEMPITDQVYQVLFENKNPKEAVDELMLREPKPEL